MRSLLIIATIVVLSAAKPGGYHHQHYQFEQSSAAYRNNDLQHKHDEAGRYTKFEDLDSSDEPQENMNYHRTEYNAPPSAVKGSRRVWKPTTNRDLFAEEHSDSQSIATNITPAAGSQVQEESQTPTSQSSSGSTSFDDNHPHFRGHHFRGHSGRYHGYSGGQSGYFGHDHSADFHRSHHGEGFQRGYHSHHTGQHGDALSAHRGAGYGHSQDDSTTSEPEMLAPIEDDDTIFNNDKFKQYGFGKEYLDNTEGATNNANGNRAPIGSASSTNNENPGLTITSNIGKPVDRAIGISSTTSNKPDQGSLFVSPTSPSNQNTAGSSEFTTNTATNIGLATSFADSGNRGNSQIGQENVKPVYEAPESETISQSAVATASEDDLMKIFAKIDQIAKDMGEQQQQQQQRETQHGMAGTQTLDQYGRNQLDARRGTQQDISDIRTAQTFHSTQQQMQFGSQDFTQQSAVQFNQGQQKDLTQQTQVDDLIEKTDENSGQDQHNDMTQQTYSQHGQQHLSLLQNKEDVGKLTLEDLTQQTQDGFATLEFGSQHQADLTQQTQDEFSKLTQDGFDKLEFTSQSQDMIQQSDIDQTGQHTQDGFGKLEMGSQVVGQHDLRTQQTQDDSSKLKHGGQEDLTQQTQDAFGRQQDEFGKLEFAGQEDVIQQEDLTQQTQDGFGKLEFAGQEDLTQQEQLTQQTQDGFGKLEFAGHEDLTQQTQQEDLTQQTQDEEFGKLEFAGRHEDLTQQADLTQHTQDEFGKLELDQHRQQEDLTQHTQDGFGKLEIASQHHETQYGQHQSQYSRSHSYSTNYNYGEQRTIAAETTQDLTQQQKAHETLDVTQQVQKNGDLILDEQKESDLNQMSSHDIEAEEEPTVKPGFWKRVGSSISKTYEKAKVSLG